MEYTIAHRTAYFYPEEVHESYTVMHLQPRSDALQFCSKFEVRLSPDARVSSYVDRFGNDVHHFAVLASHGALSITTTSHVVTLLPEDPPEPLQATRAGLEADPDVETMWDYLRESAYVQFTPELSAFWGELEAPGERIGLWCHRVSRHIKSRLAYDTSATNVRSTVREALAARAGVCQDFAHIMIAVLRSAQIPARYVSGYIFRGDSTSTVLGAEASHGWCEAYLPPYGWIGFDPTNDRIVNDRFVRIAIGRDYRDVSPVRGVYRGSGHSEMSVNVGMELLQMAQQQQ
jgi:transglutaminase-like putative cysteine protease